jgi:serine/threonine protein phosphatase PrpC
MDIDFSSATDKNGSRKPNQDRLSVLEFFNGIKIILILDGHGKLGHLYADIIKEFAEDFFSCCTFINHEIIELFFSEAQKMVSSMHDTYSEYLHTYHKGDFYTKDGKIFDRLGAEVNSGTTCSLVVFYQKELYVANAGDSSVFLLSQHPINELSHTRYDSATGEMISNQLTYHNTSNMIELTTDTPVNSLYEFNRAKLQAKNNSTIPLRFVYDNRAETPIFQNDQQTKLPEGCTSKTIRGDIAYRVIVPDDTILSLMLNMTRTIGDFKIIHHGGSYKPIITHIKDFESLCKTSGPVKLLCATDGLWDVWEYDKLYSFMTSASFENLDDLTRKLLSMSKLKGELCFGKESRDDIALVVATVS